MQNFICFVNEQLRWEQESPHRHDCHDPPYTAGMGFLDDRSPPRRLPAVARSDPWRRFPAGMLFPGDAHWRRRLLRVAGSADWSTGRGKDCQQRYLHGEGCYPGREFCGVAGSRAMYGRVEAIALVAQAFFLAQENLASFPIRPRTRSWSFGCRFLKVAMHLLSYAFCEAPPLAGIASGSLSPSKNSL